MTAPSPRPQAVLLMGVSGCGKCTVGALLGERLGWPYRDADSFHPAANIGKMSRGEALSDEDRRPWLAAIRAWMDERLGACESVVVSCSALKRAYREVLRGGRGDIRLVFLQGPRELIAERLAQRKGHFMPAALLDSQLAALEAPGPEESALVIPITEAPEEIVARIIRDLGLAGAAPGRNLRPSPP